MAISLLHSRDVLKKQSIIDSVAGQRRAEGGANQYLTGDNSSTKQIHLQTSLTK